MSDNWESLWDLAINHIPISQVLRSYYNPIVLLLTCLYGPNTILEMQYVSRKTAGSAIYATAEYLSLEGLIENKYLFPRSFIEKICTKNVSVGKTIRRGSKNYYDEALAHITLVQKNS